MTMKRGPEQLGLNETRRWIRDQFQKHIKKLVDKGFCKCNLFAPYVLEAIGLEHQIDPVAMCGLEESEHYKSWVIGDEAKEDKKESKAEVNERVVELKETIVGFLRKTQEQISATDLSSALRAMEYTDPERVTALRELLEEGSIIKEGKRRGAKYSIP